MTAVVLIGNGPLAISGLAVMLDELRIAVPLVVSDGDGVEDGKRPSLVAAAVARGYKLGESVLQASPNSATVLEAVAKLSEPPTLVLSLQAKAILRPAIIGAGRLGAVNLHNAPLPLLRGCDPFAWAIHDGLLEMGITLHVVPAAGVDDGPILGQRFWPIGADTTAWDLYQRALPEGTQLLRETLPRVLAEDPTLNATPQASRLVTYHPMGQFDYANKTAKWSMTKTTLSAHMRSRIFPLFQLPNFFSTRANEHIDILSCCVSCARPERGTELGVRVAPPSADDATVALASTSSALHVACKWGALAIGRVRLADGSELDAAAWADMCGIAVGDQV